ncbi:branched-chain amino acid ABC transporter permease [Arthrobacter sp. NPDC089319]|uniref:branched-chain amino acid ABC transporter permease n=1 Tax=Arthrobacter sp. NPDC089319 TaxID=3155915 RepID=UPI00344694E9
MSADIQYYVALIVVFACVAAISCWGLDVHFGHTGILNFAFITSHAVGAYTVALLTLGAPEAEGGIPGQAYFWGTEIPFPFTYLIAILAGILVSLPLGLVALRRLRSDYQAIALLAVAMIASVMVIAVPAFLGGGLGLHSIPAPLEDQLDLPRTQYSWFFAGFCVAVAAFAYLVVTQMTRSPLGRTLRAVRDNPAAADALGVNIVSNRMVAFAIGNGLGALSGALLVSYLGTWSPNDWLYGETLMLLGAVIVGGAGNKFGVLLGALLIPVALTEGARFLPPIGAPGTVEALQFVLVGIVIILFLWFRPQGIVPELRRRFDDAGKPVPALKSFALDRAERTTRRS